MICTQFLNLLGNISTEDKNNKIITVDRDALQFLSEFGSWRLLETTEDVRASSFLFQRILVQRFNSVLLHDGVFDDDWPE